MATPRTDLGPENGGGTTSCGAETVNENGLRRTCQPLRSVKQFGKRRRSFEVVALRVVDTGTDNSAAHQMRFDVLRYRFNAAIRGALHHRFNQRLGRRTDARLAHDGA